MELALNRQTRLAIAALEFLRHSSGLSSRKEIADHIGTSVHFLAQVVRPLTDAGWVVSHRGPTGGYALVENADQISLLAIVEAVEGPVGISCVLRGGPCSGQQQCSIHSAWSQVQEELRTQLGEQSI